MALPASGSATLSSLPALKVVLIGGPCSGKGSIAPLLSKVFRMRAVSVGQLLRGEVRSGTTRGRQVRGAMEQGELLDDSVVLQLVRSRVIDSWDAQQNGWQLVGFPRSLQQARDVATDESEMGLRPDCVIVLDRPDELCKEFALGRMVDSVTGKFFHPDYAPPPADICESGRLMWRSDDTTSGIEKRISNYKSNIDDILAAFSEAGVPVKSVDNARCDLETFAEIASYLENLAREKIQQVSPVVLHACMYAVQREPSIRKPTCIRACPCSTPHSTLMRANTRAHTHTCSHRARSCAHTLSRTPQGGGWKEFYREQYGASQQGTRSEKYSAQ